MIKKLIPISVILALAVFLGFCSIAKAGGADVVFNFDTPVNIYYSGTTTASDLVVKSNSQVKTFARGTDNVTITLDTGSDIIFESASGKMMSVTGCTATYAVFKPGTPSQMQIQYHATDCGAGDGDVVLTISSVTLTEVNVAADPLTAATASDYIVTFRTANTLTANQKIKLVFGTGYTIADTGDVTSVEVTDETGTSTAIASSFTSNVNPREVIITLTPSGVAASRVIKIVLTGAVTNPAVASLTHTAGAPDLPVLGIDIYTTTSGDVTIDSKLDQTPYNRIIELQPGWNIFAPSQELEDSTYTKVLEPIGVANVDYSDIVTLQWHSSSTMTWQTPSSMGIAPLYGYAVKIIGSTVKLPLDFAKETGTNGLEQRLLTHNGWHIIGYVGTAVSATAQAAGNCVEGLKDTGAGGKAAFSSIVDLTGTAVDGSVPTSHAIVSATTSEVALATTMKFAKDYGYAIAISAASDSLTLTGRRGL